MPKRIQAVRRGNFRENNKKAQIATRTKKTSAFSRSNASSNPNRPDPHNGKGHLRSKATINRLNMYNEKPNYEKMKKTPTDPMAGRLYSNRKYWGNTRQLDQKELDKYTTALNKSLENKGSGHSILISGRKLPVSLLKGADIKSSKNVKLLDIESFEDTFGGKARRKKPRITSFSLESLAENAQKLQSKYNPDKDGDLHKHDMIEAKDKVSDKRMEAGQSKRIWEELYKVLDSSDVLIQVVDARDPMGTRVKHVEEHLKKNCPNKHLVIILNKCDLIPTSVTAKWIKILSKEYPTLAYKASINNPFGKGSLIQLLRQFDNFHKNKKSVSVGFIGYPNVGKSSIINSLRKKTVCKAAPVPGETKVWQYITLTRRIYLIDCPGIVYNIGDDDTDTVLKGVIRPEKLEAPDFHIQAILDRADQTNIIETYGIAKWTDAEDFLEQLGRKTGKLMKGGDANQNAVAKQVITDWQRGRIRYMVHPSQAQIEEAERKEKPVFNPALLVDLHKKDDEDDLINMDGDEALESIEEEIEEVGEGED
uniref:Nucleolar GTP-binding protein 2 n=1 Tax=Euplotes crassus TaxID=5936 RepID=A0A7S3KSY0_EUPCR|mmetsp:Transcript_6980/g.6511  ORF Transcript_6980/g.6511 Transcript_6980/m.6511 type:complete len:536 (+) Transcript_6980:13-1620(+)|eukprot:CAMPEP_0197004412 /NCGR_PEP_ID=MMETSP1380-20130617/22326_1 /TAXON_ID=5936 /ORGANISM="Euplotes crassus, Strain CT5" /LENGTH=535 /DNA_ID=CAMNT_0042423183 /DNA_START=6 /DNA_END=1613 /DNA_ORIENTATION=+